MGKKLRVVFMGTPSFAVACLDEMYKSVHTVVGIVTTPDKPAGRGQQIQESAVKKYALELNVPILQPEKLKSKSFILELGCLQADVFVVVAFRILPKEVFTLPKIGTFNLHASLLPQLRGAAPINFALINGYSETGVTTFFLDEKVDTGAILMQEKVKIEANDDASSLHDKLMILGKKLVIKTLDGIAENTLIPSQQTPTEPLQYAPKIEKEDTKIDWGKPIIEVHNFIRGMSPYPCSFTEIKLDGQKKTIKIFKGKIIDEKPSVPLYTIDVNKNFCRIALESGWYEWEEVQMEGKKRMNIKDFINGIKGKDVKLNH